MTFSASTFTPIRLLVLGFIWMAFQFFILGKFSVLVTGDTSDVFLPMFGSLAWAENPWAAWNPASMGGTSRLSFGSATPLYIWLYQFIPGWLGYQGILFLNFLVGIGATYLLCRRVLALDSYPSAFAGLLYGCFISTGSFLLTYLGLLPGLILAISWTLEDKSRISRWLALAAIFLLITETTYISALIPYVGILVFLWFLIVEPKRKAIDWLILLTLITAMPALRFTEISSLVANAPFSSIGDGARFANGYSESLNLAFLVMINMFRQSNWLFSVCLAVFALGWRPVPGTGISRLLVFCLIFMALPFAGMIGREILLEYLPFVSGFNAFQFPFFFLFAIAILGGIGLQGIQLRYPQRRIIIAVASAIIVLWPLPYKLINFWDWISQGSYVANFESPVIENLALEVTARNQPARVEAFQMYNSQLQSYGLETFGGNQAIVLKRFHKYWTRMLTPPHGGPGTFKEVEQHVTHHLMTRPEHLPKWPIADAINLNMLSLANVKYMLSRDQLLDPSFRLILGDGPDTPWSALSTKQKVQINLRQNFTGRDHLYVYENTNAFPRFFMVENVLPFNSQNAVLDAVSTANLAQLRSTAFVEIASGLSSEKAYVRGEIISHRTGRDEIELSVFAPGKGFLVITNSFSPYWKVRIDGVPASIYPVYGAFWGIEVPKAAVSIVFTYQEPSLLSRFGGS